MKVPVPGRETRRAPWAALVLSLAVLVGCDRPAAGPVSFCEPYTGAAPLAIRGIAPGQAEEEVVALLGPPDRRNDPGYGVASLQWQRFSDLVVTADTRRGRVKEVLGGQLDAAGEPVVSRGMSEDDVRAILGKPSTSKGTYRPSGSGVISLGTKRTGCTLWYERDGRAIEISVQEDGVAWARLVPQSP